MKSKIDTEFSDRREHWHFLFPKFLSLLLVGGLICAIYASNYAMGLPSHNRAIDKIYADTWAGVGLVTAGVASMLLAGYFKGKYSIFWAKALEVKLDERERSVRNRVFLRAYRWMIALMLFGLLGLLQSTNDKLRSVSGWVFFILAVSLPSIIASFHKNAR
jgi:hypothetical protein